MKNSVSSSAFGGVSTCVAIPNSVFVAVSGVAASLYSLPRAPFARPDTTAEPST